MLGRSRYMGAAWEAREAAEDRRIEKIESDVASLGIPGVTPGYGRIRIDATVTLEQASAAVNALAGMGYDVEPRDVKWLMEKGSLEL